MEFLGGQNEEGSTYSLLHISLFYSHQLEDDWIRWQLTDLGPFNRVVKNKHNPISPLMRRMTLHFSSFLLSI